MFYWTYLVIVFINLVVAIENTCFFEGLDFKLTSNNESINSKQYVTKREILEISSNE